MNKKLEFRNKQMDPNAKLYSNSQSLDIKLSYINSQYREICEGQFIEHQKYQAIQNQNQYCLFTKLKLNRQGANTQSNITSQQLQQSSTLRLTEFQSKLLYSIKLKYARKVAQLVTSTIFTTVRQAIEALTYEIQSQIQHIILIPVSDNKHHQKVMDSTTLFLESSSHSPQTDSLPKQCDSDQIGQVTNQKNSYLGKLSTIKQLDSPDLLSAPQNNINSLIKDNVNIIEFTLGEIYLQHSLENTNVKSDHYVNQSGCQNNQNKISLNTNYQEDNFQNSDGLGDENFTQREHQQSKEDVNFTKNQNQKKSHVNLAFNRKCIAKGKSIKYKVMGYS